MTNTKYGKILAIATAICVTLLGIAFIACCTHLYFTGGDNPFTRESVGRYLVILAVPSFITIALAIGGFVFAYVNKTKDDELAKRTNLEILESFKSRFVFDSFDEETKAGVLKLKKQRDISFYKCMYCFHFSSSARLFPVTARNTSSIFPLVIS